MARTTKTLSLSVPSKVPKAVESLARDLDEARWVVDLIREANSEHNTPDP